MPPTPFISPTPVTKEGVLARCDYFIDIGLWPRRTKMNPERWLSNFRDDEIDHAVHLLNGFLYFPNWIVDELFRFAFQSVSAHFYNENDSFKAVQTKWRQFQEDAIFTYVTGDPPNPSDSGMTFTRKVRQILGVKQTQIMTPRDALGALRCRPRPVVFVDDFVGTGNQFVKTWRRLYAVTDAHSVSFESEIVKSNFCCFYCPVFCTEIGLEMIQSDCKGVVVHPAHILGSRYSALSTESIFWPEHLRSTSNMFIEQASRRAGYVRWKGYGDLGLAIAFEDGGPPNATLPLIYSAKKQWKPLIPRE